MRKSLYILGPLADDDIEWMISYGRRRVVERGEVIIRQGEPVAELYLILEGTFSVSDDTRGGREVTRLGAGEIVGEMSFVDAHPPSATVTAVDDGVVLALERDLLQQKLDQDSGFAARFYRAVPLRQTSRNRGAARLRRRRSVAAGPLGGRGGVGPERPGYGPSCRRPVQAHR